MQKVEIIAEVGINHNGDIELAHTLIDEIAPTGADTIKFQMVKPELVYKPEDPLFEIFKKVEFTPEEWISLKKHCEDKKIEFLCTPGDMESAFFLNEEMGVSRFKIASDSAEDVKFVNKILSFGKPTIISMGMVNNFLEITRLFRQYDFNTNITILHCVSNYPTLPVDANLRLIEDLRLTGYPVGYSDHVEGTEASIAAVVLGAKIIEKHIKLDDDCVDAIVSITPTELKKMVDSIRKIEKML